MHHDGGGDWDSELGEGLIDAVVESGAGGWVAVVVLVVGLGLLAYHFWS